MQANRNGRYGNLLRHGTALSRPLSDFIILLSRTVFIRSVVLPAHDQWRVGDAWEGVRARGRRPVRVARIKEFNKVFDDLFFEMNNLGSSLLKSISL